jgi:hypothetical protein
VKVSNVADETSYLYKYMMEGKKAEFPSIKLFNNPGWIDQQLDPETVTPVFHVDHKEYLEEEQKLLNDLFQLLEIPEETILLTKVNYCL